MFLTLFSTTKKALPVSAGNAFTTFFHAKQVLPVLLVETVQEPEIEIKTFRRRITEVKCFAIG